MNEKAALQGAQAKSSAAKMQQAHKRHIPLRTCVVCRQKAEKRGLVRVVRAENGVIIDHSGKLNGRGAYLCDRVTCWERAITTDVLSKALKTSLTSDDRERLRQEINEAGSQP